MEGRNWVHTCEAPCGSRPWVPLVELQRTRRRALGRTERQSGGDTKPGILSDAVEAILGAMYLDAGLPPVERLLRRVFAVAFDENAPRLERDPKTRFQEWVMTRTGSYPTYDCVGDTGVDGDEDRFTVEVYVGGEGWGQGTARNKRMAERLAATRALERMEAMVRPGERPIER